MKKFESLVGLEGSVLEISNELQKYGVEDIGNGTWFDWSDIIDQGNVVAAIDETGENHIQIYFDVVFKHGEDEIPEASIINITKIEEF